jgi:hypothetical protein
MSLTGYRAIYRAANARTAVEGVDGKLIWSDSFPIRRGVIQGDILSPLYFILALELILRNRDKIASKGVDFGGQRLHTLGYADDAALLDDSIEKSTARVTSIAAGSRKDADMEINITKTYVMQVGEQGAVSKTTDEEAKKICKFTCKTWATTGFSITHTELAATKANADIGTTTRRTASWNTNPKMTKVNQTRNRTESGGKAMMRVRTRGSRGRTCRPQCSKIF